LVNEIPVNITLTSKAKETLKDIEALSSKTQTVKVNVQFTGGLDLKSIEEKLNQKPIKLDNFTVTDRTVNALRNILQTGLNAKPIKLDNFSVSDAVAKRLSGLVEEGVNIKPIKLNNFSLPQSALNSITNQIKIALESKQFNITVNAHTNTGAGGAGVPSGGSSKSTFSTSDIEGRQLGKLNQLRNANGTFTGVYYENDPYNISSGGKGGIKGTRSPVYQGVDIDGSVSPASQIAKRNQTLAELAPDIDNYELRALEGKQRRARELAARFALEEQNRRQSKINQDNQIDYYENLQTGGTNARRSQSNRQLADLFALQAQQAQQNKINQDNQIGYYEDVHASGVAARRSQSNRQLADLFAQQEQRRQEQASGIASFNDARLADRRGYVQGQQSRSQSELEEFVQKFGYVDASNPEYLRLAGLRNQKTTQGIGAANYLDLNLAKQVEASQKNIKEAGESYNSSFFGPKASEVAEQFGVDESVLPSSRRFLDSRRLNGKVGREIGLGAILSLANGQGAIGTGFQVAGSLAGGAVAGTAGASIGGAIGIAAYQSLDRVANSLRELAEAGLTFERSVLGITAVLSQTTTILDQRGNPVADQFAAQRERARNLQLEARSQAAEVGIGGETESSLVQAIVTGFGSKGVALSNKGAAKLTARFGSALNILAPELASNPAVTRRDIFDIASGTSQASRTALGSRLPEIVGNLKNARTEDEILKATDALDKFIEAFKNDSGAVTQIQRFNAQFEILKTNFGESFVGQFGVGFKALADSVSDPKVVQAFNEAAAGLGALLNEALKFSAKAVPLVVNPRQSLLDTATQSIKIGGTSAYDILNLDPVKSLIKKTLPLAGELLYGKESGSQAEDPNVQVNPEQQLKGIFQSVKQGGSNPDITNFEDLLESNPSTSVRRLSNAFPLINKLDPSRQLGTFISNTDSLNLASKGVDALNLRRRDNTIDEITGLNDEISGGSSGIRIANIQDTIDELHRNQLDTSSTTEELAQINDVIIVQEAKLADERRYLSSTIDTLIAKEQQLGSLRLKAIDTTTFAGQDERSEATIDQLGKYQKIALDKSNNANLSTGQRDIARLEAAGFGSEKKQEENAAALRPFNQAEQYNNSRRAIDNGSSVINESAKKFELLNLTLDESAEKIRLFGRSLEQSRLGNISKAAGIRQRLVDLGGESAVPIGISGETIPTDAEGLKQLEIKSLQNEYLNTTDALNPLNRNRQRRIGEIGLEQEQAGIQNQISNLSFDVTNAVLQVQKAEIQLAQLGDLNPASKSSYLDATQTTSYVPSVNSQLPYNKDTTTDAINAVKLDNKVSRIKRPDAVLVPDLPKPDFNKTESSLTIDGKTKNFPIASGVNSLFGKVELPSQSSSSSDLGDGLSQLTAAITALNASMGALTTSNVDLKGSMDSLIQVFKS
jgi:hypothetical protein